MKELLERIICAIHVLRGRPLIYAAHLERGPGAINLSPDSRHVRISGVVLNGPVTPEELSNLMGMQHGQ